MSSRRSPAITATPPWVARSRRRPPPGRCRGARPSGDVCARCWSAAGCPRPCLCRSSRLASWPAAVWPTTASASPTPSSRSSRSCGPRSSPAWWGRWPTTGRIATTASFSSRSATRSSARRRRRPTSPTSASGWGPCWRARMPPMPCTSGASWPKPWASARCSSSMPRSPGSTPPAAPTSAWTTQSWERLARSIPGCWSPTASASGSVTSSLI